MTTSNNAVAAFLLLLSLSIASLAAAQTPHYTALTIEELFAMVDAGNASLRQQQAGIEVADRAVDVAKSERLPDISASVSVSYNGNILMTDRNFSNAQGFSSPHFGNSFSLQAQQMVYTGGAVTGAIRLSEVQLRQAEQGYAATQDSQRFVALGLYLDLLKSDNAIQVYESNIALTQRLIDDIESKYEQGMALRNDVTRYELQMQTLTLALRKTQDQRAILNYQLCNALGIEYTEITPDRTITDSIPTTGDGSEGYALTAWQTATYATSPLLRQSALGIDAAEARLKIAKSELLPKVAIFAADNFSGPYTYDIPPIDNNINVWYVGVGVSYSLSALFKSNKSVRHARSAVQLSRRQHAVTTEQMDNDVQQAYTLYRQAYVELATQRKSVQLAAENYDVVNNRYLEQLALITDMIDASDTKLDAELKEVDARVNIIFALYKLRYLAGTI